MASLTETAISLLAKVKALDAGLSAKLDDLQKTSEKLTKASQELGESWSGSAVGYNSELHFGNFEKSPLGARFNPEWGGIHGLPDGWCSRTADEVKERVEKLAGATISSLEEDTAAVLSQAKALQAEIVTEVSTVHTKAGLEQEKKLLTELEAEQVHTSRKNRIITYWGYCQEASGIAAEILLK